MDRSFRPSWIRPDGSEALEKPTGLVVLLALLGLLAGTAGLLLGAGIASGMGIVHGLLVGTAWALPYWMGAVRAWKGAEPIWYAIIRVLAFWGALMAGGALLLMPEMGFPFGDEGGRDRATGEIYAVWIPLLIANVFVFIKARAEEIRFYGDLGPRPWRIISACVALWYLFGALL